MVEISPTPTPAISFPEPLGCIFEHKPVKVLWGGRGAGRSWSCARALLILGMQRPLRILCARELQKSIEESVHKLLSDQILNEPPLGLNLSSFYTIQKSKIFGRNGTEFFFEGIRNNVTAIKSIEGIDICWVEEGNKVTEYSWNVLIPTLYRRPGGELWITFNPDLEKDYTYQRFVVHADPKTSFVVHMTWRDNPWFPAGLMAQMERDKARDLDVYMNVWEGRPIRNLKGTVYANELRALEAGGRVTIVPWERSVPVDVFCDLGRADHTSLWFAQMVAMQRRVVQSYQNTGFDITHYIKFIQSTEYTIGTVFLPHDGKAKVLGTKLSIEEQLRAANLRVRVMPKLSIADGINATRLMFPSLWFDEKKCKDGLEALRAYRWKVDSDGHFSREPLHDWSSDFADGLRTMALASRRGTRSVSEMQENLQNADVAAREFVAGEKARFGKLRNGLGRDPQRWMN